MKGNYFLCLKSEKKYLLGLKSEIKIFIGCNKLKVNFCVPHLPAKWLKLGNMLKDKRRKPGKIGNKFGPKF